MSHLIPKRISLASQVTEAIRQGIAEGAWKKWLPGERALCEQLNVSRPTLRLALHQLQKEGIIRVDSTRRRHILQPARRNKKISKVVALLTPIPLYAVPPHTLFWIDEMRDHLIAAGYKLEIHHGERLYRENPNKSLASLVQQTRAAGWLLWLSSARMQRWFSDKNIPCLIMGSCYQGVTLPSLDLDQRAVCRHAVSQFYARGHRRIAFMIHTGGFAGDLESIHGIEEAHAQFASSAPPPEIVWHDSTLEGIVQKLNALLRRPQPPTAFLVARSATVLTVLGYLLKRGLQFPKDALLISRDHDSFLEYMVPTVARYALNPGHYAKVASRTVIQLAVGEPLLKREIRLTPNLIKGDTFS